MIRESPDEFLSIIRSHAPDVNKPLAAVRKDYSSFFSEMQEEIVEEGTHSVEKVPIRDDLIGYWISVPESDPGYVVLFFHGGEFTRGSTRDHLGLCIRLARAARALVFSVDYRLAPEHLFPAPVEDAIAAYWYLQKKGYLPHRIIPTGISAGGNLVLASLLSLHAQRHTLPPAAVCMSPVTDLQFRGESVTKNEHRDWLTPAFLQSVRAMYLGSHKPSEPFASPVNGTLKFLPRLYIQVGTHELLLSDIGTFVEKARWTGVPVQVEIWEGMFHAWQVFAGQLPEGQEAIDHVGTFMQNVQGR
jgi:acetyl esterase/lipase